MDAESLNFFLNDKAKSAAIVKKVALELKEQEKNKGQEATAIPLPTVEPKEPDESTPAQKSTEKKQPPQNQVTLFGGFLRE
jgi:hypothetical protein